MLFLQNINNSLIESYILLNMKPESKRTAAIIVGSVFICSALLFSLIVVGIINGVHNLTGEEIGFMIVFAIPFCALFLFFGIRSLVIGLKTYQKMKKGRIREAKVEAISPVQRTILYKELTVSYYGESGEKYELVVIVNSARVKTLEVGQYIQCYVLGETCYVDTDNIKVVRDKKEEIDFE